MKAPEVIYRRPLTHRPKVGDLPPDLPPAEPPKPERPEPRGWRGLAGQVAGEFRSYGGRVWTNDTLTNAKNERRFPHA